MAPKRVAKVASKPGSKKSAPVPTYKNGEPKVKWIHYAPEHSKKRPWRIQITGMVCFLGFYFVLLKLYFLFPFVRRRSTPSPPSSSRSFVSISSKQSPSKKLPLRIFSFHFYLDRWCTRVSRLWWRTLLSYLQALLFFLTFFVASTAHRTSLAGLVSPFVPGLAFLTCFFAFTAHLTCLDRWGFRSSPFGAVRSRPCFF